MKIRSISINRMPGFERGGPELPELGEGLNLIIGPNGAGKTTVCRAIRGLLWPETLKGVRPVSLEGKWISDGTTFQLQLEGVDLTCRRDGASAQAPGLPGPHLARCFTITVDDLFTDTETDSDLANDVTRAMAGGYDLGAIRQLEWFKLRSNHARSQRDALKQARQEAKAIQAQQEHLRSREEELADLEQQEQEARQAQASRGRLDDAIELIKIRDQIAEAQKVLETFPADMDRLRGGEIESLNNIREDLDNSSEALEQAAASAETAEQQLTRAALPQDGIPETRLDQQRLHLTGLREAERELRDADRRLGQAETKTASALEAFGGASQTDKLDAIDTAGLDDIQAFHRQAEDYMARKSALEGRLGDPEPGPAAGQTEALINGIRILREWFEAGSSGPEASQASVILAWASAALIGVIAVALSIFVSPWRLILLPAAVVPAVLAYMLGRPASSDRRLTHQESYARLSLEEPAAWDRRAVGKRLNDLEESLAQEQRRKERETERESCKKQLAQLAQESEDLNARREALIQTLGLAPESSNLALVVLAENLRTYRAAKADQDACRDEVAKCRRELDRHLEAVNEFLTEFGEQTCDSHDSAAPQSEAIFKRAALHINASEQLTAARRDAASAKERVSTLKARKAQLFQQIALDEDNDSELEDRLARLDDYKIAARDLDNFRVRQRSLSEKLDDAPELKELSIDDARDRAIRLEAKSERYRELIERITEIRSLVDQAGRANQLEAANADARQAADLLAERRDEAELAAAGEFLLDRVEDEHKTESQPEVFRHASKWFSQFTRGRYELRIDDSPGSGPSAFRALDTSSEHALALDELSRGTRMQLLLAVRLAFAACNEHGTQLPFVLDEVLNSTDPGRYRAIAECLLTLVKDGRQVFYMTCQPGDADGWRQIAEEVGVTNTLKLDLGDVRRQQLAAAGPLDNPTVSFDQTPHPGEMTLSEYKTALRIPPLKPSAGAAANHIAHFIETPEQLHQLVRADVETYGQLQSLKTHGKIDAYVSDELLTRTEAIAAVIDEFAEAWRIGRGRNVSKEVLLDAGVSTKFIDRVTELAEDLNWDARRLVEALGAREDPRAAGFRKNTLESVTEYLEEQGYLDPRDTLDREAAYIRVLAAANDHVARGDINANAVSALFKRLWDLETEPTAG